MRWVPSECDSGFTLTEKELAGPLEEGKHDLVVLTPKGRPIEQRHVHCTLTKMLE